MPEKNTKSWAWVVPYALAIVIALVLAAALSELDLFRKATLGTPKVTAATIVRFLGYGGALALFWILARRAMHELRNHGAVGQAASLVILPLTTLCVVLAAYYLVLLLLSPVMSPGLRGVYNWLFILGVLGVAIWLAVAIFRHSETLVGALHGGRRE